MSSCYHKLETRSMDESDPGSTESQNQLGDRSLSESPSEKSQNSVVASEKPKRIAAEASSYSKSIHFELLDQQLWQQLGQYGTEMIVSKEGRSMFPSLRLRASGLENIPKHKILLGFIRVDDNFYKYSDNKWAPKGKDKALDQRSKGVEPDKREKDGSDLIEVISFKKLKLANNKSYGPNRIKLRTMCKYVPYVSVLDVESESEVHRQDFWEAQFIAVTSYQNEQVKRLKKEQSQLSKNVIEADALKNERPRKEGHLNQDRGNESSKFENLTPKQRLFDAIMYEIIQPFETEDGDGASSANKIARHQPTSASDSSSLLSSDLSSYSSEFTEEENVKFYQTFFPHLLPKWLAPGPNTLPQA